MPSDLSQPSKLKSTLFCVIAGLLLGVAQPLYVPPLLTGLGGFQEYLGVLVLIGYVPLFWLMANKNLKASFGWSFLAITVQHTVVLYWIYIALNVHGDIPPIPAAVITMLLPMLLAAKGAIFLTLGRFLSQRFSISFFWVAPFALCTAEYFRNFYIYGGFPWGNVGYSLGRVDEFLQVSSLVGVYGLVFFVGLVNALFCVAWQKRGTSLSWRYVAASLSLIIAAFLFGTLRLHGINQEFAPSLRVALLQGNIPQEVKRAARLHASEIIDIYLDLTRRAKREGAELVIWPESSYPRMVSKDISDLGLKFEERVASIVGVVVYGENPNEDGYYVHNSGLLMDYHGNVVRRYDKSHLVPFGEYVPWPLSGVVDKIVPGLGTFKPGIDFSPAHLTLSESKKIAIGTTVCYEGIFPEISRAYARSGASLLVNLTNDAWYGFSSAPFQHLLMYRMRSAESGLPFLRATNTGVSAWIDAYGGLHQSTALFERGLVIADVPLLKKKTLYAAVGDIIPIISALLLIIGYVMAVLPVHHFIRQRQWRKLLVMAVLAAIPIAATIYFERPQFLTDESARTKILFIFLLSLLLMIGLLSKTKRSRSILFVASAIIVFTSVALAVFETPYFLFGLVLGLLIYLLAFRIREGDKPIK